jgi:DtxR family transcriptional regulator, Mn-dependent transcriptional regulator
MVNKQRDRSRERACEDYVKAIYHLTGEAPVRAVGLAQHLHVSRASVSKSRRVLEAAGLVKAQKGRTDTLRLTAKGRKLGVRMVRRHRLIETFLHKVLGVPLERVHADAERIEHAVSDDLAGRLAQLLRHPATDPHGHPIPPASASGYERSKKRLSQIAQGAAVLVTAIDDRDRAVVRRLKSAGILPGLLATVLRASARGLVLKAGRRRIAISNSAAANVRCAVRGRRAAAA